MVDFLKANPFMTMEDYLWRYSIPLIKIMGYDNSHVNYLSEKEAKRRGSRTLDLHKDTDALYNDLGVKINFPTKNE